MGIWQRFMTLLRSNISDLISRAEDHAELVESVEQLRREVAELAERVDFTERLLGQQKVAGHLERPRP